VSLRVVCKSTGGIPFIFSSNLFLPFLHGICLTPLTLLSCPLQERALLRRAPNEALFGVQLATNQISEGVSAGRLAAAAGASWVDLNCGCPIYEATRRGLGAALLRKPAKLARLVAGIAAELPVPLTVKIRIGETDAKINVDEVTALLAEAGAAVVTIYGRTMQQRYKRPADWGIIEGVAASANVPIVGNGDVLTHYEASRRMQEHGCLAVMVGRGALIRPWIFQEHRDGAEMRLDATDRVAIYRRLVAYNKEHFGDDVLGRRKAMYFLPWHFDWFTRYRPLPEAAFSDMSRERPLIGVRWPSAASVEAGEVEDDMSPLERLLRCQAEAAHAPIAETLWDAESDAAAVAALERLAGEKLAGWEEDAKAGTEDGDSSRSEGRG
jgi:tRNA-dihydrouridine synthase 3